MPATDPARDVWNDTLLQNPHEVSDKRTRVQKMFAAIAPSYDLNNRLHSLWMDQRWRRRAVKLAGLKPTDVVVDVACGTGDLTIKFAKALFYADPHHPASIFEGDEPLQELSAWSIGQTRGSAIGVDFTYEMLPVARTKAARTNLLIKCHPLLRRLDRHVRVGFVQGDALRLPLPEAHANILSIAFGIRNVAEPLAALKEFHRVLKPGGRLIILEFSLPTNRILRALYNFYFTKILPRTATWISRDKTGAYKYLPQSVNTFISRDTMQQMMKEAGFTEVQAFPLTFGICICYRGIKS